MGGAVVNPDPGGRVIAFCPWIRLRAAPFEVCGVRVMGFREAEAVLDRNERGVLERVVAPYADHFLNDPDRTPHPWNQNPLLYALDPARPLRGPTPEGHLLIALVNSCVYIVAAAANRVVAGQIQIYTNSTDWTLYFHRLQDPDFFALRTRRLLGQVLAGGFRWNFSVIS